MRRLLAIVPARGGSKGVPRKNMRRLAGRPLVGHMLAAVEGSGVADVLVVSTEDAEIATWVTRNGYRVVERPQALATDAATIAAVAKSVAEELAWEGDVAVFQPTSPLVSAASIRAARKQFIDDDADSMMSVVRDVHLCWHDGGDGSPRPLFSERVNRQWSSSAVLRETGAIQFVRGSHLRATGSMVGEHHALFELEDREALDIDTVDDLEIARRALERSLVIFRLRANELVGAGHLYHCLRLAEELAQHELVFLLVGADPFATEVLDRHGYRSLTETDLRADLATISGTGQRGVVVNDVLDTTELEILVQRELGFRVVNIEDLGPGARYADWIVNALYRAPADAPLNVDHGPAFATLRPEFLDLPAKVVREEATRVLVTFGGTDPSGLTARVVEALHGSLDIEISVILGPGSREIELPRGVSVRRHVDNMAVEMAEADVIVTSAGRTVYEAAATGTPVVVLAQNAREATHAHLGYESGVVFLGIGPLVDDADVVRAVKRLLGDAGLRRELSDRLQSSLDGLGAARIGRGIDALLKGL